MIRYLKMLVKWLEARFPEKVVLTKGEYDDLYATLGQMNVKLQQLDQVIEQVKKITMEQSKLNVALGFGNGRRFLVVLLLLNANQMENWPLENTIPFEHLNTLKWPADKRTIARLPLEEMVCWYAGQEPRYMVFLGQDSEFKKFWKRHYLRPLHLKRFWFKITKWVGSIYARP